MDFKARDGQLCLMAYNQEIVVETNVVSSNETMHFVVQEIRESEHGWTIHWHCPTKATMHQTIKRTPASPFFTYELQLTALDSIHGFIQQTFGMKHPKQPYFMIPGALYGTNNLHSSKGVQPQLVYRGQLDYPKTPLFYTRADRSTHNAVLCVNEQIVLGIRIVESTFLHNALYYNGLCIDTSNLDEYDRIGITLGYAHLPVWYRGKLKEASIQPTNTQGYVTLQRGDVLVASGQLYLDQATSIYAYENVLETFYYHIHQAPIPRTTQKEAIEQLASALIEDAYNKQYHYFPSIVKEDRVEVGAGDSGWTGGMQVVYPLTKTIAYVPKAKDIVLDYIHDLVTHGFNKQTHFFYESKLKDNWQVSGWWADDFMLFDANNQKIREAYSGYVNGQVACYLLKSVEVLNQLDPAIDTSGWVDTLRDLLDHVIAQQRSDGAFGAFYSAKDGSVLCYDSFQGAWFFAAIAQLAKRTHNPKYLAACKRAVTYYRSFIEKAEAYGMPMDAKDAVDEEGNLAFITGLKTMHELTQEKEYLDLLVHCLHYEFSWKFAYNTRFVNKPLHSMQWSSCGGSITSTHNLHIHPMGNLIVEEMKYAYEQTNNPYLLSRLQDTLLWGLQSFNTKDYHFGFGTLGWATEQFFHTDGVQDGVNRIEDGGIWKDYLPWGAACILLSLCNELEGILPNAIANARKEEVR